MSSIQRRILFALYALAHASAFMSVQLSSRKTPLNMVEPASVVTSTEAFSPVAKSLAFGLADISATLLIDQDLLPVVGVAVVVLCGAAVAATQSAGSSSSESTAAAAVAAAPKKVEKIDVSIPYDAAARLAYRELKGLSESAKVDETEFQKFKEAYETTTVASVIVKKMERDLRAAQAAAEEKAKELAAMV